MEVDPEPFRQSWPATVECVRAARVTVCEHLHEVAPRATTIASVGLAVSEAATTIVENAGSAAGRFTVTVEVRGDAIILTVGDEGDGVVPARNDPRRELSLPIISGLSDGFIRRVTDEGGVELRIVFPLD